MKKSMLIFAAVLLFGCQSFAQQKTKTLNMMITIHSGSNASHPEIIITKENGTQEVREAEKKSWLTKPTMGVEIKGFLKTKSVVPEVEDSLFQIFKPYFNEGWKLISSNVIMASPTRSMRYGDDDILSRYFFTKEAE